MEWICGEVQNQIAEMIVVSYRLIVVRCRNDCGEVRALLIKQLAGQIGTKAFISRPGPFLAGQFLHL